MPINRRGFIKGAAVLSLSGSLSSFIIHNKKMIPKKENNHSPEIEQFKIAQQNLLNKYNVEARSKYVKLNSPAMTAHILEAGRGDPVLMLHGGGAYAGQFAPLMSELQKDFGLYIPDRPGCGLSDRFNYTGVAFRQHAIDFVLSVLDALKLNKVSLIGNSMGGYWALLFALSHPERVNKLLLIGEPAGSSPPGMQPPVPPADPHPSIEGIEGFYKYMLVANFKNVPKEIFEADLEAAKLPGAALAWNTMIEQFKPPTDLGTYNLRPQLKNLQPQTMFIWGDQDKFGPPKLGQEMSAIIPHGRIEVVQHAGHLVWLDQLEHCASLAQAFLKN